MRFISPAYDIEAWIEYTDDGRKLPEHRAKQRGLEHLQDGFEVCDAMLEIEEGRAFAICVHVNKPQRRDGELALCSAIDGRQLRSLIYSPHQHTSVKKSKMEVLQGGRVYNGALQFSPLRKAVDEEDADVRGQDVNKLCSISIIIVMGHARPCWASSQTVGVEGDIGTVHEKRVKLGSTIVPSRIQPLPDMISAAHFTPRPVLPNVCRFEWKYATRDVLTIKGIIPDYAEQNLPGHASQTYYRLADVKPKVEIGRRDARFGADVKPNIAGQDRKRKRLDGGQTSEMGTADRPILVDMEDSDNDEAAGSGEPFTKKHVK